MLFDILDFTKKLQSSKEQELAGANAWARCVHKWPPCPSSLVFKDKTVHIDTELFSHIQVPLQAFIALIAASSKKSVAYILERTAWGDRSKDRSKLSLGSGRSNLGSGTAGWLWKQTKKCRQPTTVDRAGFYNFSALAGGRADRRRVTSR